MTTDQPQRKPAAPDMAVEELKSISLPDLNDLCDATDQAIEDGGGFGWVQLPARDVLERYWQGVLAMPARFLFVARLDGVICGTAQLVRPAKNNEAQSLAASLTTHFIAPWARGYGLAEMILELVEQTARDEGFSVINLDVRETQTAAIKLYERCGYQEVGRHPFYAQVEGAVIPGRYYYKALDPAADK